MSGRRMRFSRSTLVALLAIVALLQLGALPLPEVEILFPHVVEKVTDDFITVSGNATNSDFVMVKLNDWDWLPAEGNERWHLRLPLAVGGNSIWVKAVRFDGTESLQDYAPVIREAPPGAPAITVPVNHSIRTSARTITAQGTAPAGTQVVLFRANHDDWRRTTGTQTWSGVFQAVNGMNSVEAVARTAEGLQSAITRITFTYNPPAQAGAEASDRYE